MNLRPLRPDQQQNARANYRPVSQEFVQWVNRLGIERTWVGRLVHKIDQRLYIRRVALLLLFCLLLSFIISWDLDISYSGYKEGDLAMSDIKSPLTFDVIDTHQTEKRRLEAEQNVPSIYDYDVSLYDEMIGRVHRAFKHMRSYIAEAPATVADHQADFESELGGAHISDDTFGWLASEKFRPSIENIIVESLEHWSTQKIVDDRAQMPSTPNTRIIVNVLEQGVQGEEFIVEPSTLLDVPEVRRRVATQNIYSSLRRASDIVALTDFIRDLIVPNLTLNKQVTESKRKKARDGISDVVVPIRKGQVIVHAGEALQSSHITVLDALSRLQETRHQDFVSLVTAVLLVVLLLVFRAYLGRFTSRIHVTSKDACAMGAIVISVLLVSKFVLFIANTALIDKFPRVPSTFYGYLLPAAAGSMMVGLLISYGEVVWLFSIFIAVVLGLLMDRSFSFMVVTFSASVIAARGVMNCKRREDIYWAGLKTGLVSAILITCVTLMGESSAQALHRELLWNVAAGFVSGLLSSFLTLTLVPLWENLFVYTTDVRLLELSNLNHPLLKDLIVKAPGTYHHSLVVGSMCEAAAEQIGANPLLAKVCAYYHDIGKMNHAQYFIENQRPGENRHDHISPGMSKTILIAHVKDGVEMGLEHKLGGPIIDVIEQHHGTTLISFFYHKAKEREDTEMHETSEEEYRYPGPKPQFREAALCMLADSIEAAARSLDEPTPARLQNIVHNIVQKKFLDGQLDECILTLKDLTLIEDVFSKILLGIYHQRIDYPTTATRPIVKRLDKTTV